MPSNPTDRVFGVVGDLEDAIDSFVSNWEGSGGAGSDDSAPPYVVLESPDGTKTALWNYGEYETNDDVYRLAARVARYFGYGDDFGWQLYGGEDPMWARYGDD